VTEPSIADKLRQEAHGLGFVLFGIAPAVTPEGYTRLVEWIKAGYAADMTYFESRIDAYADLNLVLEGTRSVVVLGYPYKTTTPVTPLSAQGRVARYAWGTADYHDLIHPKLKRLRDLLLTIEPRAQSRGVVDSAPVMEREFAQLAGLGWTGKNTLLLNRQHGSYFFLSCLLTTVELPASQQQETDHCGTCRRCLDACPTNAFVSDGVLDSRRCISYQTIENRNAIPHELRAGIGDWLFGCDVCQEVCPWNRFGEPSSDESLWPHSQSNPIDLIEVLGLDDDQFRERFRKTPLWRSRRRGIIRNATICLGNAKEPLAIDPLIRLLDDSESIIRGAAAWALGEIGGDRCLEALNKRLEIETDEDVRGELRLVVTQRSAL